MNPIANQAARESIWDLVIDHVEDRRSSLSFIGKEGLIDRVIADMRERDRLGPDRWLEGDQLRKALPAALEFIAHLAADLRAHGVGLDAPIDVRAPGSERLVRVQAMLWDHVRTAVQIRALIEGCTP